MPAWQPLRRLLSIPAPLYPFSGQEEPIPIVNGPGPLSYFYVGLSKEYLLSGFKDLSELGSYSVDRKDMDM